MRGDSLRNIPLPNPDAMEDGCQSELPRAESESSGVTVESSHHRGDSTPQGQSVEWTNEKHNAYLDYLEASFVHQLHGSMGLGGWSSKEKILGLYSSQALSANDHSSYSQPRNSICQLMVLRDGNWQKIKYEENGPLFHNAAVDSHGMLDNPCHFTSVGKYPIATSFDPQNHSLLCDEGFYFRKDTAFSCEPAGSSEQHLDCHLGLQNLAGGTAEVSDQNFVDEDQGDGSSSRPAAKRLRTAAVDASTDDQVVPFGKLHTPNVSTVNHASSEREERAHHELFSEHSVNFPYPKSDMHIII